MAARVVDATATSAAPRSSMLIELLVLEQRQVLDEGPPLGLVCAAFSTETREFGETKLGFL